MVTNQSGTLGQNVSEPHAATGSRPGVLKDQSQKGCMIGVGVTLEQSHAFCMHATILLVYTRATKLANLGSLKPD